MREVCNPLAAAAGLRAAWLYADLEMHVGCAQAGIGWRRSIGAKAQSQHHIMYPDFSRPRICGRGLFFLIHLDIPVPILMSTLRHGTAQTDKITESIQKVGFTVRDNRLAAFPAQRRGRSAGIFLVPGHVLVSFKKVEGPRAIFIKFLILFIGNYEKTLNLARRAR